MAVSNNKKAEIAAECCKLANERFGLEISIMHLLNKMNCCDITRAKLIKMAKDRSFDEFNSLLASIPTKESGGACFVTINKPRNFNFK